MIRAAILGLALTAGGCAQVAEGQQHNLDNYRIREAVNGYESARRRADLLDMCVRARLVSVAYADAKDAANAEAWKSREREACAMAVTAMGIERPAAEPAL